jgi:hypothetical protein
VFKLALVSSWGVLGLLRMDWNLLTAAQLLC